ncbi:hypothetical protein NHX12_011285, partial [Muraenolepis orangiensis]
RTASCVAVGATLRAGPPGGHRRAAREAPPPRRTTYRSCSIDYQTFLTLSDEDLKEVGVATFGARRKMLLSICELTKSKRRHSDTPSVKSAYLEGGASGRLPPIVDVEVAGPSKHW